MMVNMTKEKLEMLLLEMIMRTALIKQQTIDTSRQLLVGSDKSFELYANTPESSTRKEITRLKETKFCETVD